MGTCQASSNVTLTIQSLHISKDAIKRRSRSFLSFTTSTIRLSVYEVTH